MRWLERFAETYQLSLKRFFQRRAPDLDAECEDLVQEVFLRLAHSNKHEKIEHPQRYIFKTATNVLTDWRRRRTVRMADAHGELSEYNEPVDEVSSPERVIISREEILLTIAALDELTEKVRVAFILHRFEELSYAEIAVRMEVSASSVEKYIMKALAHLAARLNRGE